MNSPLSIIRDICSLVMLLSFLYCGNTSEVGNPLAGNTSEVGNPTIVGSLFQSDGQKAVGAFVSIHRRLVLEDSSELQGIAKEVKIVKTDSNGIYKIDSISIGLYVIEGNDQNSNIVLIDSIRVVHPDSTTHLHPDTLRQSGAIKGVIKLYGIDDPRYVLVLSFGIDRSNLPDTQGNFIMTKLAQGTYNLRFLPTLINYGVFDIPNIVVLAGQTTNLDTINLPYWGVPTPAHLKVVYDTLLQNVTLTWDRVEPALISGYNVYRKDNNQNFKLVTDAPLSKSANIFIDSTVVIGGIYEYRIVSINASGTESPKIDSPGDSISVAYSSLLPKKIKVKYDTLLQRGIISWQKIDTSLIAGYNVYRSVNDSAYQICTQNILTKTTMEFVDSAIRVGYSYKYFVASKRASGREIPSIDTMQNKVIAVSSQLVTTISKLITKNARNDSAAILDTLSFCLNYTNPTREIVQLSWYVNSSDSIIKSVKAQKTGFDTLRYVWKTPGKNIVKVRIVDAGGGVCKDSGAVEIIADIPSIQIKGDSIIAINTTAAFTAAVQHKFGAIVNYQFTDGLTSKIKSSTDSFLSLVYRQEGDFILSLEITNNHGLKYSQSKAIKVINDAPKVTGLKDTVIRINHSVNFTVNASDTNGVVQRYFWNFGDNSLMQLDTSAVNSIKHTFPSTAIRCSVSVAVADSFGKIGRQGVTVTLVNDSLIAKTGNDTVVSVNDSFSVSANGFDKYGVIQKYRFDINGDGIYEDSSTSVGIKRFKASSTPGDYVIVLQVANDDNLTMKDTMILHVLLDPPVVFAGNDTTVLAKTNINLHGIVTQNFGVVAKWEWDIGNSNNFISVSHADTIIVFPDSAIGLYSCILKVTDDDGNVAKDTMSVQILKSVDTTGLIVYYPFNGTIVDATNKGSNLVNNGAVLTTDRFGNANKAYYFDGSKGMVATANTLFSVQEFTMTAWIKGSIPNTGGFPRIVSVAKSGQCNAYYGLLYANGYWSGAIDNSKRVIGFLDAPQSANGYNLYFSKNNTDTTTWHHAAISYGKGHFKFYIDGVLDNDTAISYSVTQFTSGAVLQIGYCEGGGNFTGKLDDIRVYNRVLTDAEIANVYSDPY